MCMEFYEVNYSVIEKVPCSSRISHLYTRVMYACNTYIHNYTHTKYIHIFITDHLIIIVLIIYKNTFAHNVTSRLYTDRFFRITYYGDKFIMNRCQGFPP